MVARSWPGSVVESISCCFARLPPFPFPAPSSYCPSTLPPPSSPTTADLFLRLSKVTTFCSTVSYRFFLRNIRFDVSLVLAMNEKICEPTLRSVDGDSFCAMLLTFILTLWLTWSGGLLLPWPWVRFEVEPIFLLDYGVYAFSLLLGILGTSSPAASPCQTPFWSLAAPAAAFSGEILKPSVTVCMYILCCWRCLYFSAVSFSIGVCAVALLLLWSADSLLAAR